MFIENNISIGEDTVNENSPSDQGSIIQQIQGRTEKFLTFEVSGKEIGEPREIATDREDIDIDHDQNKDPRAVAAEKDAIVVTLTKEGYIYIVAKQSYGDSPGVRIDPNGGIEKISGGRLTNFHLQASKAYARLGKNPTGQNIIKIGHEDVPTEYITISQPGTLHVQSRDGSKEYKHTDLKKNNKKTPTATHPHPSLPSAKDYSPGKAIAPAPTRKGHERRT